MRFDTEVAVRYLNIKLFLGTHKFILSAVLTDKNGFWFLSPLVLESQGLIPAVQQMLFGFEAMAVALSRGLGCLITHTPPLQSCWGRIESMALNYGFDSWMQATSFWAGEEPSCVPLMLIGSLQSACVIEILNNGVINDLGRIFLEVLEYWQTALFFYCSAYIHFS